MFDTGDLHPHAPNSTKQAKNMENESQFNPETEKALETLTENNLKEIIEKEDRERYERLCKVFQELADLGDKARFIESRLDNMIEEPNHRAGEHAYDWILGDLSAIEEIIKKYFPDGKLLF